MNYVHIIKGNVTGGCPHDSLHAKVTPKLSRKSFLSPASFSLEVMASGSQWSCVPIRQSTHKQRVIQGLVLVPSKSNWLRSSPHTRGQTTLFVIRKCYSLQVKLTKWSLHCKITPYHTQIFLGGSWISTS